MHLLGDVAVDWPVCYLVDHLGMGADGVEVVGLGHQNLLRKQNDKQGQETRSCCVIKPFQCLSAQTLDRCPWATVLLWCGQDELVKVTRITSGATWPWSTWGHRSSCSSCPPTAGRAPKPREPGHWASPQKHQCKANILRGWSSHHHSCLLHRLKTSIDILHGDVETGLQPHDILSEIYWDTKISTEGISPC